MLILQQMLVLFFIMLAGFFAQQKQILDEDACKKVSWIVVNIANPAMILSSVTGESRIQPGEIAVTILIALLMFLSLMILASFLPVVLHVDKSQYGVYRVMTVFSNIGFMGFPILSALYGKESLLYAALFVLIYNVLIYTYGILCLNPKPGDGKEGRESEGTVNLPSCSACPPAGSMAIWQWFAASGKRIVDVGVLASLGALVLYFGDIPLPGMLVQVFEMFADLTAPLSMMVIGASFGQMSLKDMAGDVKLLVFSAVKLLAVPISGMWVVSRFVDSPVLLGVCMVMLATPVGSMTAMLAQQYDCDSELASKGVALTTLLSVAAIPLVAAVCRGMGIAV